MGRVFLLEEVPATIPAPYDFAAAKEAFEESVARYVDEGILLGGAIFGSVAKGTATMRSDFDCMVTYDGDTVDRAAYARSITRELNEATRGKVPVGIIAYSKDALASGRHEIDRFFGQQLKEGPHATIGTDPTSFLQFREADALDILTNYIHAKKRKMLDGYTDQSDRGQIFYKSLGRMLELPVAIGRKVIQVQAEIEGASTIDGSDKPAVLAASMEIFSSVGLDAHAANLQVADKEYTELLDDIVAGRYDPDDYYEFTDAYLLDMLPLTYQWLDQLEVRLIGRLKKAASVAAFNRRFPKSTGLAE